MREIVVEGITKRFANRIVLDNVSFQVNKGEIHGFLGPNGAGKTTTMRIIANLLRPDAGRVLIEGVNHAGSRDLTYNHIGYLLEDPPLYRDMSVLEYLRFVGQLKKISKDKLKSNIDYCADVLDLSSVMNRSIENLSKGYKQRVGIAQALIHKPRILILDEPTVGLDPQSVVEIRNLILNLKNEHTVILSSHLLHEMSLVCDQVTIIREGKILESGSIGELRHRLAGKMSIVLTVQKQTAQFDQFLKTLPGMVSLEKQKKADSFEYLIVHDGESDIRTELLKQALDANTAPVGLVQHEYNLEEIFMRITESEK